jgi:hypothetical protein
LLKGAAQKENIGVGSSQTFAQGFAKYISDGASANKDVTTGDSTSLPFTANPASSLKGIFGGVNSSSLLGLPNRQASSGAGSIISGNGQLGGASSTDETNSNN